MFATLSRIVPKTDTLAARKNTSMHLLRNLMVLSLSAACCATAVQATDFYVQPANPGPVKGTALSAISLQAMGARLGQTDLALDPLALPEQSLRVRHKESSTSGTTAGKWLRARRPGSSSTDTQLNSNAWSSDPTAGTSTSTSTSVQESSSGSTGTGTGDGSTSADGSTGTDASTSESTTPVSGATSESAATEPAPETTTTTTKTVTSDTSSTQTEPTGTDTQTSTTQPTTATNTSTAAPAPGSTWQSLSTLLSSGQVKGGDRIFLMDGYHGAILIRDQRFTSPVVIAPVPGQTAHAESIQMRNTTNVVVQGLKVWATSSSAGAGILVRTYGDTADLSFLNLDVRSVADAANYVQWDSSTWLANKRNGFLIDGNRNTVSGSRITGLYHGLQGFGTNVLLENNIIDGFSGDGLRALGDSSIVRNNKVQNCFQIDGNHADGFQSFSRGTDGKVGTGTVRNLVIENNKLFEWTSSATNPLRCKLQGIGMFDGMFDGILIRNNLITSSAYHGITIAGALNSTVVNNTVIRPDGAADKAPWIMIGYHKNGTPSKNTTVANNLVTRINTKPDTANNIVVTNNIEVTNSSTEFTSVNTQNFTLKSGAQAIDAGTSRHAPPSDIVGATRPKGKAPDAGAYENF
ncbi:hypothetical protein OEZ60_08245 [Defluviimonas sp. WL0024]|uniref:Right handed beta helix domain-containing protein n=1 Tax=Albidovulum salinarum TaxID=2984153 RepID=A0ABT2X227_9RHOB|nr:choice-of-anchor Q domain-containing protein [Defluviimonas sp. WL0024]MCU9847994.1 hypothetical protein [Defluviimonas sp. WL0024]